MDQAGADRPLERRGAKGEGEHDQSRGQGEGGPGRECAERPGAQEPECEADLARSRAWKELAERDQIGIARLVDPAAAHYELVAKVAEMRNWPAKGGDTELQEGPEHLAGRAARLILERDLAGHPRRPAQRALTHRPGSP